MLDNGELTDKPVENEVIKLSADIASYLATHAGAADTFEGLVSWWLFRQQLSAAEEKVRAAVDYLEKKGLINTRKLIDGTVLYSARAQDSS